MLYMGAQLQQRLSICSLLVSMQWYLYALQDSCPSWSMMRDQLGSRGALGGFTVASSTAVV